MERWSLGEWSEPAKLTDYEILSASHTRDRAGMTPHTTNNSETLRQIAIKATDHFEDDILHILVLEVTDYLRALITLFQH
jgi:hypothetical protein